MNRTAQVNSIDVIDHFRGALNLFGEEIGQALSAIHTDLQRFQHWIEHDQLKYWQREIRVREERLNEAKGDLHRCLAATIDPNRTPSCHQEKKLVAIAKQRLEEAERKLAAVKHWIVVVRQAVVDYHARVEPLSTIASADVPRAAAELARTVARLVAYLEVAPPSSEQPDASSAGAAPWPGGMSAAPTPTVQASTESAESSDEQRADADEKKSADEDASS